MKLYGYYRSTSSYRVRIALALKGLEYEYLPVNLLRAEHKMPDYLALNPQGRVPVLVDEGYEIVQSPAILEHLELRFPQVELLSDDVKVRTQQRAVAALIGCDIHPLHNVAVLNRLRGMGHSEGEITEWIAHWIGDGLSAIEQMIGDRGFCFTDQASLADVYLIPQLYAAERFNVPLDDYPKIRRVQALAVQTAAFVAAHPDRQPDHPSNSQ